MRVLIISALFACAAAAPSGIVAPLFYQQVAVPAVVPTISPGDIQAAAIDAQVKINDLARAAADKAQLIADEAVVKATAEAQPNVDLANEKNVETFWSNEDKKWQALDALKTAEAQIDGTVASNAAIYAKAAVGGVVPVAPIVAAPIPTTFSAVYNPYFAALKSISTQTLEVKAEEKKEEKEEAAVKTAEPEQPAAAEAAEKVEAATEKSADKPLVFANTIVTPYSSVYRYDVAAPVGGLVAQPLINYASIQPVGPVLAPTYLKSVW